MPAHFYVGAKVRLQIRVEDFTSDPPPPETPPVGDGPEAFGTGTAQEFLAFQEDTIVLDLVPYSCTVELNSYRMADTCRVSVPLARAPFDPRIIRMATVQVFGGTYTAEAYAQAMGPIDAPGLILPDFVEPGRKFAGESNELFRGFVDDAEIELGQHDELRITARDLTGRILDQELPENALKDIPRTATLTQVIQLILTGDGAAALGLPSRRFGLPGFRGTKVVAETAFPVPTLAEIKPPQWYSSSKTAKKGRKNSQAQAQKMSYWDMITDLCVSAGLVVYMRPGQTLEVLEGVGFVLPATEIVITDPATYYEDTPEDVFDPIEKRAFIYGQNISTLRVKRKLGGVKTPTIEVRSQDSRSGKRLSARYPPASKKKNNRPTVGSGDTEEVKTFVLDEISGPNWLDRLEQAARSIYEQLGRGEMEVHITTKHLSGLRYHVDADLEADLFQLRPSHPMIVEISPAEIESGRYSSFTLFTNSTAEERVEAMAAVGIDPKIAAKVAAALDNDFIQREFRCQRVVASWDHNAGWGFEIDGINYLDVRDAVSTIDGTSTEAAAKAAAAKAAAEAQKKKEEAIQAATYQAAILEKNKQLALQNGGG